MPTPLTAELLPRLRHGQRVRCRQGRHTNGSAPAWGAWTESVLYVMRRTHPLPRRMQQRARAGNVGDILTLAVEGCPAEFNQSDWTGTGFNAEEYLLEIELLDLHTPALIK